MCRRLAKIIVAMQRWRTAFTLVELLVVVGVIAVLIGILMPVVNRSRAMAVRATCQANLRSIGVCLRAYLNDNRDIMPLACAYPWVIIDPTNANYTPPITNFLGPLLREPQVFICKADTVHKYYLRVGGMSYYYNGSRQTPTGWTNGLGGAKISMSSLALSGVTERNINVMSDFDSVHPVRGQYGGVNYLYADWHVADYQNQD